MRVDRRVRLQALFQSALFVVLLATLTALLAFVAREYRKEWDVTRSSRNTLSSGTAAVLKGMQGPLHVTAYAVARDTSGTDLHEWIREKLKPYQRVKPDIALDIVDPREEPQRAAAAGIRSPNEVVLEYHRRTERLRLAEWNEQNVANALVRLVRGANTQVLWLEGHGERRLDGIANHDLGEFGNQLRQRGLKLSSLNLAIAQEVPANASLLVISCPQVDLQPAEVEKVKRYVDGGGNLLWLIDPAPLHGLQPIAETLGLVLTPGVIVDPYAIRPRSGPPAFAVSSSYANHPVTAGFTLNTLFPYARQIGTLDNEEWRVTPLVEVAPRGWVETGKLDEHVSFDRNRDFPGPVPVAAAFERTRDERQQRVVIVGSGQFLANSFLGNGGNLRLGLAMVNWLVGEDALVPIEPRPAADARIELKPYMLYVMAFSFLLALPAAFALTGGIIWWRRRRAA
jgi:ABC-type uncharacterized transport system involved in gliding motility auxiliary subunit